VKVDARGSIMPEMLSANIDDVVAWTFDKYRQHDVYMLSNDSVSYSVKKGKKGGKKYEVSEGSELDANTLAGEIMKPRSVKRELRTVVVFELSTEMFVYMRWRRGQYVKK